MAFVAAAAPYLAAAGTAVSAIGTIASGNAANTAAQYSARQMDVNAGQERATSQRQAMEERKKAELLGSRARAVAAASGGGATDPSVLDIEGDIAGQGEYNALTAMFNGEERARGYEANAAVTRFEGKQAKRNSRYQAFGTILSGATSLADRYASDTTLPWQRKGNVRPQWMGGGTYA